MGVGCCFLLQGIFPTQGSNPRLLCLLHRQVDSLLLSHLGSPLVSIPFIKMWKGPSFGEWTWSICSLPMDFRYLYFILSKEEVLFFYYCCLFCFLIFVGVKLLSHVRFIATLWTVACQASLSFTISWSLLRIMSIESCPLILSNHLILCQPFSCLQSFPASGSFPMRWPKYWSFSFSISPSNEYSGLISFRMDWFDLLAKL